jgi:fructose-1,6-bisphosphatase/inositol monophosphatase family enzyme
VPYTVLKSALYDRRVKIPKHDRLYDELVSLEWDGQKEKVDHRPKKSKGLADCLEGVVYNPCLDELFVAEKGQGATLNGKPISVSSITDLKKACGNGIPLRHQRIV